MINFDSFGKTSLTAVYIAETIQYRFAPSKCDYVFLFLVFESKWMRLLVLQPHALMVILIVCMPISILK